MWWNFEEEGLTVEKEAPQLVIDIVNTLGIEVILDDNFFVISDHLGQKITDQDG